ncbi:hypothetical protein GXP67_31620 [Rhodocytophaga rosea]|uniref:Hyalin n=1 Tax=Rhodocytophaga rosea TaxID=2704465 RepID=A0A6C0GS06_9BACT|nr:hypothetical protein [Rhodocytophaga rosea]QHT70875.1 hypothetical protein GXP67_31620 [Rhodocytophaga rosea]
MTNINGTLYFTAQNAQGQPCLWKSNGTTESTVLIKAIEAKNLTLFKGSVYFSANENYTTGYEIWKTDGTPAGTVKVLNVPWQPLEDIFGYGISRAKIVLKATDNLLYFTANNDFLKFELWRTDGTSTGAFKLKDVELYFDRTILRVDADFISEGNTLYFSAVYGVFKTDGSLSGTTTLFPNQDPYKHVKLHTIINGTIYLSRWDEETDKKGYNVYKKDIALATVVPVARLFAENID